MGRKVSSHRGRRVERTGTAPLQIRSLNSRSPQGERAALVGSSSIGQGVRRVEMFRASILLRLFVGVVAGPNQGPTLHDTESEAKTEFLPMQKLFRWCPAGDGQVLRRRLKILTDGQDIRAVGRDVAQSLFDLGSGFAEAEHNARLGDETPAFCMAQYGARTVVTSLDAHWFLETLDGLDVVIKDIWRRIQDDIDVRGVALKIRCKDFDRSLGIAMADGADSGGPDARAAVVQFVARDARDDAVLEVHLRDGVSDASWFPEVELSGAAGGNCAKVA